jgi:cytochrome c
MARLVKFLKLGGVFAILATPAAALDGNADAGKKVFAKCGVCHGIGDTKKPIGPNLNNVVGRTAGTQPEFLAKGNAGYSKAMVAAGAGGLVWTDDQILEYITDPKKKIPGNKMAFPGLPKEQDRADVLAYIKTFSTAQ